MSDTNIKELHEENAAVEPESQEQEDKSNPKKIEIKDVLKNINAKQLDNYMRLPIEKVEPDPEQPRKVSEKDKSIDELAESIKTHGLMNPVHVRYIEDKDIFQIINGERRYLAFKRLKRKYIPAILFDKEVEGETDKFIKQLVDNLQREDLTPLEESEAYEKLSDEGLKDEEIAEKVKKGRSTVNEIRSISKLPDQIKEKCRKSDIPISKDFLIGLAKEKDIERQEFLLKKYLSRSKGNLPRKLEIEQKLYKVWGFKDDKKNPTYMLSLSLSAKGKDENIPEEMVIEILKETIKKLEEKMSQKETADQS